MPGKGLSSREAVAMGKDASVEDAAKLLKRERVEVVIVTDQDDRPIGILTDGDIVLGAVAEQRPPSTTVSEIMSKYIFPVQQDAGVASVIEKLEKRELRQAVVVDKEGRLRGLVSSDDLMRLLGDELHSLAMLVSRQVSKERHPLDV